MTSDGPAPVADPRAAWASGASGLALLAGALFLARDAVGGRIFFDRDIHLFWLAQMQGFRDVVRAGGLPLWDPHVSFGHPMLANPNTQVLYPLTWLGLLVEPGAYYTLYVLLHLFAAGTGLLVLARRAGASRLAATVGGLLFMGSGPVLSLLSQWHHFGAACLAPWVLVAAEDLRTSPARRRAVVLGLAIAGQALVGSPDMSFLTVLVATARCLCAVPWRALRARAAWRVPASLALAALVAAGAAAALWIPTLEVTLGSARWKPKAETSVYWSLSPLALTQLATPAPLSALPLHAAAPPGMTEVWHPLLRSIYLGLAALGLALIAARTRSVSAFWLVLPIAALLWAMGQHTPFYRLSVVLLPPLRMLRHPAKAAVFAALGLGMAAAAGVDAVAAGRAHARHLRTLLVVPVLGALCAASWIVATRGLVPASVFWQPALPALGAAVTGIVLLAARLSGDLHARGLAALAVLELFVAHRHLNPTAPPEFLRYRPPLVDTLRAQGAERIYVWDYALRATTSLAVPVRLDVFYARPHGGDPDLASALAEQAYLYPLACSRWGFTPAYDLDHLGLFPPPLQEITTLLRAVEGTPAFLRLLQVGAVDDVVALQEEGHEGFPRVAVLPEPLAVPIRVFAVPDHVARAYAVTGVRPAVGTEATLKVLLSPDFDPSREVVLPGAWPQTASTGPAGRVTRLRETGDRLLLRAEMNADGHVVVADTFARGWRATVDGRPAPVLQANGVFRAVAVAAGVHEVELRYRPLGVTVGALVSAATLGALALVGGLARRRRRAAP